jgi:hypothetical protein
LRGVRRAGVRGSRAVLEEGVRTPRRMRFAMLRRVGKAREEMKRLWNEGKGRYTPLILIYKGKSC